MKEAATHRSATDVARRFVAAVLLLGLGACAVRAVADAALRQARASYSLAASDPDTAERAPVELRQAHDELERAEVLLRQGGAPSDVDFFAYLADRHARIAEEAAQLKRAQDQIAAAAAERAKLLGAAGSGASATSPLPSPPPAAGIAALEQQVAALPTTSESRSLALDETMFAADGATLAPAALPVIEQLAAFLRRNPERTVLVEGFNDGGETAGVGLGLAQARADAVGNALIAGGVDNSRILARGLTAQRAPPPGTAPNGQRPRPGVTIVVSDARGEFPESAI